MSTRILLVEGDAGVAAVLRASLDPTRYAVVWADNLAAARSHLDDPAEPPDLVLLDLGVRDGEGLDFCRAAKGADLRLPVVVLTGRPLASVYADAVAAGADRVVPKPFDADHLAVTIDLLLAAGGLPSPGP